VETNIALQSQRAEIAMEVAEQVARLCGVNEPMTTDAPLSAAGMSFGYATQLSRWLLARFDLDKSANELTGDAVTAESLASEIICMSSVF
jgi:hypothetical protein